MYMQILPVYYYDDNTVLDFGPHASSLPYAADDWPKSFDSNLQEGESERER